MPIAGLSPKETIHQELHKFKHGQLHSGSKEGPKVTSRDQAIAIALSEARRAKREFGGGMTRPPPASLMVRNEARSMLHSGPISSIVPGRTDRHNVSVGSGSYVMPADAVSHLGQSNTKAGQAILSHMFGSSGPYGIGKDMGLKHGPGAPKAPGLPRQPAAPHIPKFQSSGGGKGDHAGSPVPIVVAGGEFTIPPEAVAAVGGGDIKRGHKILDAWVLSIRKKHIKTLRGLPPPAKD